MSSEPPTSSSPQADGSSEEIANSRREAGSPALFWVLLIALLMAGLSIRVIGLEPVAHGRDHIAIAALTIKGELWDAVPYGPLQILIHSRYGIAINLTAVLFAGFVSSLGIPLQEPHWILPVAGLGAATIALVYLLVLHVGLSERSALLAAAGIAFLPLHVFQSRYMWGYEVFAVFFLLLTLLALDAYTAKPTVSRGIVTSTAIALYMISHGYIAPGALFLPLVYLVLWRDARDESSAHGFARAIRYGLQHGLWIAPLLVSPIVLAGVLHSSNKPRQFGLYFGDYAAGFLGVFGLPLFLLTLAGIVAASRTRNRQGLSNPWIWIAGSACYLAPIFLAAPPGSTVAYGYMLVGAVLLIIGSAIALGETMLNALPPPVFFALLLIVISTGIGVSGAILEHEGLRALWAIRVERGARRQDPGTKAAALLIRSELSPGLRVASAHSSIEEMNLRYYLDEHATIDAGMDIQVSEMVARIADAVVEADVILVEPRLAPLVQTQSDWMLVAGIVDQGAPVLNLYARSGLTEVRSPSVEASLLRDEYDRRFPRSISLRRQLRSLAQGIRSVYAATLRLPIHFISQTKASRTGHTHLLARSGCAFETSCDNG